MVICITGPTGVGKTKLSIELAKKIDGEIINADSTQIYKNLDIATAKISEEEKENIKHHLFDIKNITDDYNIYEYQNDCRNAIDDILKRGKIPILVGGTGLYIKSALYDYKFDVNIISNNYNNLCTEELYKKLKTIDSKCDIHPNNRRRIIRALDVYYNTNKKPSEKKKTNKLLYDVIFIGLTTDRDILYNIINNRVDKMFECGLLEEAKTIYDSNIRTKSILNPIGYKELFPYFKGEKQLDECIELIKQNSRRYAKRQYTWLNNQMNVNWFNVDFYNFNNTVKDVLNFINSKI